MAIIEMNRVIFIILLFLAVQSSGQQGAISFRQRFFNPQTGCYETSPKVPDRQLWFHDSLVIQEVPRVLIHIDDSGSGKFELIPDFYLFTDFKSRRQYKYLHFSDTSQPFAALPLSDTMDVGWNFNRYWQTVLREPRLKLLDTTMQGVIVERYFIRKEWPSSANQFTEQTIYVRKDLPTQLFHLDRELDEELSGHIFRIDIRTAKLNMVTEIDYQRFELTNDELSILETWRHRRIHQGNRNR